MYSLFGIIIKSCKIKLQTLSNAEIENTFCQLCIYNVVYKCIIEWLYLNMDRCMECIIHTFMRLTNYVFLCLMYEHICVLKIYVYMHTSKERVKDISGLIFLIRFQSCFRVFFFVCFFFLLLLVKLLTYFFCLFEYISCRFCFLQSRAHSMYNTTSI